MNDNNDAVRFSSGNPLLLFQAAAEAALHPSQDELREYPGKPSQYWESKFAELQVPSFLHMMGIEAPDGAHGRMQAKTLSFAYGVLHAITLTSSHLLRMSDKLNQVRMEKRLKVLKPAIVAPVPTYTFPFKNFEDMGIEVIPVLRDKNKGWALDATAVAAELEDVRNGGEYNVISYYDPNPHNPTGRVREAQETHMLAEIFADHNRHMAALDAQTECGAAADMQDARKKLSHRLCIMDDMIYLGLEHSFHARKPASFLAHPATANDTVVFLGVSKYGMPGIRGGLIVTNPRLRQNLFQEFWRTAGYAPAPSLIAVAEAFSGEAHRLHARDEHLTQLNGAHWHGFELFRALVQGVDDDFLARPAGRKVMDDVMKVVRDGDEAKRRLKEGIPGLKVHEPDAGFFTLLDANALRGAKLPEGTASKRAGYRISSIPMIHSHFKACGAEYLRGDTCGLPRNELTERANFALTPREIVTGLGATRRAVEALIPKG